MVRDAEIKHHQAISLNLMNTPVFKVNIEGPSRVIRYEETLQKALNYLPSIGISRLSDITGMDRVGVPNYCSYFPVSEKGQITVFGGKGLTKEQAKIGAILEVIERASAKYNPSRVVWHPVNNVVNGVIALNPNELIIHENSLHLLSEEIDWVVAWDLQTNSPLYVPACSIFHFYHGGCDLFMDTSTGLSAGNTYLEAILHAMLEVIERHSVSLAVTSKYAPQILIDSLPSGAFELTERLLANDIHVDIRYLPNEVDIPAFFAVGVDMEHNQTGLINGGIAAHPNANLAIQQALLELCHSRGVVITGAREDLARETRDHLSYDEAVNMVANGFTSEKTLFKDITGSFTSPDILTEFDEIKRRLKSADFPNLIFYDLSVEKYGFPVVRVVIPGMENWYMDQERVGKRLVDNVEAHKTRV